jgi:hypothetical protein
MKAIFSLLLLLSCTTLVQGQTNAAYGDNQAQVEPGVFAIYTGDVNQDQVVDFFDLLDMDNALTNFEVGYVVTDLSGDGVVDFFDLLFLDNNLQAFVTAVTPLTGP